MSNIKPLPRNQDDTIAREFIGISGKKYIIRNPSEPLGPFRFTQLQKLGTIAGFNATFDQLYKNLETTKLLLNSDKPIAKTRIEATMRIDAIQSGIVEASKQRYDYLFMLCTLFIVAEDEDMTQWNKDAAMTKIDDWLKYDENDFFSLALSFIPTFYQRYQTKIQSMKEVASLAGGN